MLTIHGYTRLGPTGRRWYYHAACVLRLRVYDPAWVPDLADCEVVADEDPRRDMVCILCSVPLREPAGLDYSVTSWAELPD